MQIITDTAINQVLDKLHQDASTQKLTMLKTVLRILFKKPSPSDFKDAYISISKDQGVFLYNLLVERKASNIIEFGTSFGISTLYLGAAAKEAKGKVITSEIVPEKCETALQNFKDAGLSNWIELREGDAMETLKDVPNDIDFLLLDGWNDLYLNLVTLLEPKFKTGTLIYTDNAGFPSTKPFLEYIKDHPEKYKTKRMKTKTGGAELSEYIV